MYVVILWYTIYLNYKDKDLYWDFVEIYTKKNIDKTFFTCLFCNCNKCVMIKVGKKYIYLLIFG